MSVGLEDVLDFQLWLLRSNSLPVDGRGHKLIIGPGKEMVGFLSSLQNLDNLSVESGKFKAPNVMGVHFQADKLFVRTADSDRSEDMTLFMIPERLQIAVKADPRKSYVKVNSMPGNYGRKEYGDNIQDCSQIWFYPAHSLVSITNQQRCKERRSLFGSESEDSSNPVTSTVFEHKYDLFGSLANRLRGFVSELKKRYPLMHLENYALRPCRSLDNRHEPSAASVKMRDVVLDIYFTNLARPKEEKRERFIFDWMRKNIPFPVYIDQKVVVEARPPIQSHLYYTIAFELPKT
jgi:hypothetical protein